MKWPSIALAIATGQFRLLCLVDSASWGSKTNRLVASVMQTEAIAPVLPVPLSREALCQRATWWGESHGGFPKSGHRKCTMSKRSNSHGDMRYVDAKQCEGTSDDKISNGSFGTIQLGTISPILLQLELSEGRLKGLILRRSPSRGSV
jgi:hypothetical protein